MNISKSGLIAVSKNMFRSKLSCILLIVLTIFVSIYLTKLRISNLKKLVTVSKTFNNNVLTTLVNIFLLIINGKDFKMEANKVCRNMND